MSDKEKVMRNLRELARTNPEKIRIVQTCVDADLQIEFYNMLSNTDADSSHDLQRLIYDLRFAGSFDDKKKLLVEIAATGDIKAFRFLEKYLVECDEEIKNWALLACQQCQMFLESSLLDDANVYVASGLGGVGHRLRYIYVIASKDKKEFSDFQKGLIEKEAEYYLSRNDSVLEEICFFDDFCNITVLVPLAEDVVAILQSIIDEVNQYGGFLSEGIFITNEKKVTKEFLNKIFCDEESSN
ncbi:MAG: hypothetical protein HUK15_01710 [Bacteroidales bacterium]|nr:hypothetical protein [Bacteroidales bacterium]